MKSYFGFIEKKLLSITNDKADGESDFAPPPPLISLFLAAHPPTTNICRSSISAEEIEAAVSIEMARSTQPPSQYFAQFLVLDKTIGHYFAIHAEFNNGKAKLLVIDYYEGFDCNLSHFNESALSRSPDVDLFIAGEKVLQKDSKSCSFFAIAALDAAENMPDLFLHITPRRKPNNRHILWQDLPVELVWNAQSMKYIWEHIDHLRKTEFPTLPENEDIPTLVQPAPRQRKSFLSYLTQGLVFRKKRGDRDLHIYNESIRVTVAKSIVEDTLLFLYRLDDQNELIRQLFDNFPSVHALALELVARFPDERGVHPLAKNLFSNPEKYEIGLKNEKLAYILHHPIIQELMWDKQIRKTVANACFVRGSRRAGEMQEEKIVRLGQLLLKHSELFQNITDDTLSDLIYSESILAVLEDSALSQLIRDGHLSLEDAVFVIPSRINSTLWNVIDDDIARCNYLRGTVVSPKNPIHKHTQATALCQAMEPVMHGHQPAGIPEGGIVGAFQRLLPTPRATRNSAASSSSAPAYKPDEDESEGKREGEAL